MENWSKERAHGAAGSTSGLGRSRPWPAMKKQAVVEREREKVPDMSASPPHVKHVSKKLPLKPPDGQL
jgi:hypothetical protein